MRDPEESRVNETEAEQVLVVDDTHASLKLLGDILTEAGYRVRLASDGEVALRSALQHAPALILLDIRMPGMNGYDVCKQLKADERTRSVPVIFLSVVDDEREKTLAFQLGAVDYVSKPVRAAEVLARVSTHLALRRAQHELEVRNAELEAGRQLLERRVRQRSAELEEANRRLRLQMKEQLQLHDQLRESEGRLAQIIDFLPDATFAIDLEGKVIAWNRAVEEMTGVKAVAPDGGGMIGQGDRAYALPFYGRRRPLLIDLVLDSTEEASYVRCQRVGGRIIGEGYAESPRLAGVYLLGTAAPLYDNEGRLIGAIESLRDISDRKESEDAIRVANERFASVLRAATAYSIIALRPDGIIEVMNEGAELMLGYRADELVGKATPVLFHEAGELAKCARELKLEPGVEVVVGRARRGEIDTREWTYVRRDGARLTVSLTVAAMRSQVGAFAGFICIARDVTAEKALEQQLLQSQKMECLGLLSGGVAHDFNNLLTPIMGYVELLKGAVGDNGPVLDDLLEIERAAVSAKELTQQLLAFGRKQLIELKAVELRSVIERAANILRRTIRENVAIEFELAASPAIVMADAGQIELVLVNLSINAQDAMPQGGVLRIATRHVQLEGHRDIKCVELCPGPYVVLSVSDSGVGMDQETVERIFEPFFTTKEVGKGTGLGLSTVYGIVQQHSGTVKVSSEPGKGSTFDIYLPELSDVAPTQYSERPDTVEPGTETILVAEDNSMVRTLLGRLLPGLGYRTIMASSAAESIDLAMNRREAIDLLLTDVVMPDLNGRELLERVRQYRPHIKVLFMSGYTTDVIGHHGVLDEGVHFLYKPFTLSALSLKLREALDG